MRNGHRPNHVNRQFQIFKPELHDIKYSNISKTINPIKPKFEDRAETLIWTSRVVCSYPWKKFHAADGRHLENRYDVVTPPRMVRFRRNLVDIMHNDKPMMTQRQKSKPEVEFKHGGRLFSETGSSNISTVDWDISPKSGMQADFDLPKWTKSQKGNRKWNWDAMAAILKMDES